MAFTKIQDKDFSGKDVASAPDKLTGTAAENKAVFDRAVKAVVQEAFNAFIDELETQTAADSIGAAVTGIEGNSVGAVLSALRELAESRLTVQEVTELLSNYVQRTVCVNKKALDGDITLTAADVGAVSEDVSNLTNYYLKAAVDELLTGKVDKVEGKALSANDFTDTLRAKLEGIEQGADINVIESIRVNGVQLTTTDRAVDIEVPTKTSDIENDSGFATQSDLSKKVDKVEGKALSANDFTDTLRAKLEGRYGMPFIGEYSCSVPSQTAIDATELDLTRAYVSIEIPALTDTSARPVGYIIEHDNGTEKSYSVTNTAIPSAEREYIGEMRIEKYGGAYLVHSVGGSVGASVTAMTEALKLTPVLTEESVSHIKWYLASGFPMGTVIRIWGE